MPNTGTHFGMPNAAIFKCFSIVLKDFGKPFTKVFYTIKENI